MLLNLPSELYDLTNDPREIYNVYNNASYAAVQAQLKEKLFLWFFQTSDVTPWIEDPRGGGYNPSNSASADGAYFYDVAMDSAQEVGEVTYHGA